ncbi:PREDICTED: signal-regulatory protein beta-1-like isoform X5 [Pseudopodoces humilis]|uniref:signal-regulatory protein beta-1-like isoform X5 n=1 Tax=Pseudopodoces humilis TaxID=181119 RepID=UPI0006B7A215|nr:PREDICTED: signal-regulatory protein beta-1-like isoform X5 [Pseudopodoces humilis]
MGRAEWNPAKPLQYVSGTLGERGVGAQVGQGFGLQQPQDKVSVAAGQMLTLRCTVPGHAGPGPVKWLKGWGSGNKTVYDQKRKDPSSRVTRAVNESNTDFTINIRNFQPNDVGTYYCVKFVKGKTGEDEVFQHGSGTEVSMYVKSWMQRAPTCPASRAARKRTTSTTPTCSPCPRPCGVAGAQAQPPPSMPASGQLPSDAWHCCLRGQPLSGWKKGRFCRAQ